ncbi:hypothetical protein FRB95_005040 [Tulasnella sp. JGI-2019a]|nr:hypothetical protein FRB95_005040 [Tulasnella sp. JGI-2019a]
MTISLFSYCKDRSPWKTTPSASSVASMSPTSPCNSIATTKILSSEGLSPTIMIKWYEFDPPSPPAIHPEFLRRWTFINQWTFHKGNVGFKMTISNYHIYTSDVYWSPDKSPSLLTAQAIYASEFTIVPEGQGFQLRLASDPTLVVTLWDLDPSDDCWIHLSKLPADGNADANQLWIFTKPEGEVN